MSIADEIARLHQLHQSGALTDAEFSQAKEKLLAGLGTSSTGHSNSDPFDRYSQLNQLRRSKSDRWLGGVCGGLAQFTGLESWIWRFVFFLFVACFGFGAVAYLLAWVFIPESE